MANRKRNIQMKFWVTAEEKQLIEEKMAPVSYTHLDVYKRQDDSLGHSVPHYNIRIA